MKNVKQAVKTVEEKMDEIIELDATDSEIVIIYDPKTDPLEPYIAAIECGYAGEWLSITNSESLGTGVTLEECLENLLQSVKFKKQ